LYIVNQTLTFWEIKKMLKIFVAVFGVLYGFFVCLRSILIMAVTFVGLAAAYLLGVAKAGEVDWDNLIDFSFTGIALNWPLWVLLCLSAVITFIVRMVHWR